MTLTAMRETFCQGLADGLTQSDAYRRSHDASGMKPKTINEESSRLANVPDISARVEELKSAVVAEFVRGRAWDLDRVVDEFSVNALGAREDKQWSASNAAITGIGKALGIITDKVDINVTHTLKPGLSLEQLEDEYHRIKALEAGIVDGVVIQQDSNTDDES